MNAVACFALTVVFAMGVALCAKAELIATSQSALRSAGMVYYLTFLVGLWLPICGYFYATYPDWYVFYMFRASRLPSALGLAVFMLHVGLGMAAYNLAAGWVRNQQGYRVWVVLSVVLFTLLATHAVGWHRFSQVLTYEQFSGHFGANGWVQGAFVQSLAWLLPIGLVGYAHVCYRSR